MLDAYESLETCNKFVVDHTEPKVVNGSLEKTNAETQFTLAYAEPAINKIRKLDPVVYNTQLKCLIVLANTNSTL